MYDLNVDDKTKIMSLKTLSQLIASLCFYTFYYTIS